MHNSKLKDIMTSSVVTVSPQQTVQEAAQIMSQYNIGFVPVVDNNRCVGIITDRDITLRVTAKGQDATTTKVNSVMSKNVVTGKMDMDVHEAANLMAQNKIRRLPVIDDQNNLRGVVALGDLAVEDYFEDEAGDALSHISEPASPQM